MATKKFTTISPLKTIFTLLVLACMCMQAKAETTTITSLDWWTPEGVQTSWDDVIFVNADQLNEGDEVTITFNCEAEKSLQIFSSEGDNKVTNYTTQNGQAPWTYNQYSSAVYNEKYYITIDTRTANYGLTIKGGATIYSITRFNAGSTDCLPTDKVVTKIASGMYIRNWYDTFLKIESSNLYDHVGDILRVVTKGTGDDAYAFIKNSNWDAVVSGSDKFSIAGWKYYDITINNDLITKLNVNVPEETPSYLILGGYNHIVQGVYIIENGDSDYDWDAIENNSNMVYATKSGELIKWSSDWSSYSIEGSFFANIEQNTMNNIVRVYYTDADHGQMSATDNVTDASFLVSRSSETIGDKEYPLCYHNFINLTDGKGYIDFPISDVATKFTNYKTPSEEITGELWKLQHNGMSINAVNCNVTKVEIRSSLAAKTISGQAVYTHKLSDQIWKPISLPYNLTLDKVKAAFGEQVCDLRKTGISYKEETDGSYHKRSVGIEINYKKVGKDNNNNDRSNDYLAIKANYPYIVKLPTDGNGDITRKFTFNVNADVRDYQTFTFRVSDFNTDKITDNEFKAEIKEKLKDQYFDFVSTAPVIEYKVVDVETVEIVKSVSQRTVLPGNAFYFYQGKLYQNTNINTQINSGLAYIQVSDGLFGLNSSETYPTSGAKSMSISFNFDDEEETATGINNIERTRKSCSATGVYNLSGVRMADNINANLPSGMYIVNGKKYIVK